MSCISLSHAVKQRQANYWLPLTQEKRQKKFEMNIDLLRKLVCTVNVTLLLAVLRCF